MLLASSVPTIGGWEVFLRLGVGAALGAAVGIAAGAGYYWAAVIGTALTIFALWPLRRLSYLVLQRFQEEERRLVIELRQGHGARAVLDLLGNEARHLEVRDYAGRRV